MKALLVVYSYHHMNTEKVAHAMASVLDASVRIPDEVEPSDLAQFDLVGFGSGIYGERHHKSLLDLAERLPEVDGGKAFIFSTSAIMGKDKVAGDHRRLRERLVAKGYTIVDEFACKGFNTNSFLRHFGGMNKGRPNEKDLKNAQDFARGLIGSDQEAGP
ncbi:MAG: flavodoxin family protein [Thermoplasmata archaeon]|nr:MAG: flavodoxin family protein [Thermoplasmata archaeon]